MPATRQTHGLAVVSLISGILAWMVMPIVGSIIAIITGHLARRDIRAQPERYEGDAMAVIGLVLGWGQVVMGVLGISALFLFMGGLAWFGWS
ncbi:hypothetical protein DCD74_03080 [Lysobacter oculi]|uniref:DUF4190 domain-containing protein n=1 Tax=Solilutibacter oculi TaxID=2698682 RepID=A0A344J8S2_9GAMM|nr:hypothetical protein DCD74_03080 [Lysobacter oculi]